MSFLPKSKSKMDGFATREGEDASMIGAFDDRVGDAASTVAKCEISDVREGEDGSMIVDDLGGDGRGKCEISEKREGEDAMIGAFVDRGGDAASTVISETREGEDGLIALITLGWGGWRKPDIVLRKSSSSADVEKVLREFPTLEILDEDEETEDDGVSTIETRGNRGVIGSRSRSGSCSERQRLSTVTCGLMIGGGRGSTSESDGD